MLKVTRSEAEAKVTCAEFRAAGARKVYITKGFTVMADGAVVPTWTVWVSNRTARNMAKGA